MIDNNDQVSTPTAPLPLPEFLARRAQDSRLARLTHDVVLPVARGIVLGPGPEPLTLPDSFVVAHVDLDGATRPDHAASAGMADLDFAIADRVAHTVPDLLGWLAGVHGRLRVGGVLNLALPDRRFTQDVARRPSSLGDLLEAHAAGYRHPSFRQVFDHQFDGVEVDPARLWDGEDAPAVDRSDTALASAYARALNDGGNPETEPCRCWVFTPLSFLDLLEGASRLGLTAFVISEFAATAVRETTFYACLRRDAEEDADRLRALQVGAIGHLRHQLERRLRAAQQFGADR